MQTTNSPTFDRSSVTDEQIRKLRDEALAARDYITANDCGFALEGDVEARESCIDAIEEAFHRNIEK